jgi:hypothetical protein
MSSPGAVDRWDAEYRTVPGTFTVTTTARFPEDPDDPDREELVLVDGWQIGSTYRCADGTWASWGPASLSRYHPTREAAGAAQVRAYAIDPSVFDRIVADEQATRAAEAVRLQAEDEARRAAREDQRRRERLGDDLPGPTILTIPAYHVIYADVGEVTAVKEWLDANGAESVSGVHEIRVEQRATRQVIVYEAVPGWHLKAARFVDDTETHVTTMTVPPPPSVTAAPCPDLHVLFEAHWPAEFPMIAWGVLACGPCTRTLREFRVVPWPCPPVAAVIGNRSPLGGAA